jgi:hypothetical protein
MKRMDADEKRLQRSVVALQYRDVDKGMFAHQVLRGSEDGQNAR